MSRTRKQRAGDPKRVIGYWRISTDEERQALGPEAQRQAIVRWCEQNGAELVGMFGDELSGTLALDKRPGIMAALTAVTQHKAGILLVAERSRIARDPIIARMAEKVAEQNGGALRSVDGLSDPNDAAGSILKGVIDLFSEYHVLFIRQKTREALAVKRGRGEKTGGSVPFGFTLSADGVHLEPFADEQETIERIQQLRSAGASISGIAARLNVEQIKARGRAWYPMTVSRVLMRAAA